MIYSQLSLKYPVYSSLPRTQKSEQFVSLYILRPVIVITKNCTLKNTIHNYIFTHQVQDILFLCQRSYRNALAIVRP